MKAIRANAPHGVAPEEVMAYLDGELGTEDAVAMAAHLRECAQCAALAEELGGVSRELRSWTVEEAPARLEREMRKAVRENVAGPRRRASRKVWAWGSAAVVGVLFMVGLQTRPHYKRKVSLPMMAQTEAFKDAVRSRNAGVAGMETEAGNFAALSQIAPGTAASAPPPFPTMSKGYAAQGPMIARTASLTLLVKNVADARAALEAEMSREQGYAAQLKFSTPEGGARSLQASLRVPSAQLPQALDALRRLGRVEEETHSGEEVTEQHADLVARLQNSREEEARLRGLLRQGTGKIEDVLRVEEEIARVRGEIEQMEAQQKGLEHRVDFASVELKLVEEYTAKLGSPDESTGTRLHNGFVDGVRNAGASLLNLVVFLEEFGPVLVIWGVILGVPAWLVWRRYRRARRVMG